MSSVMVFAGGNALSARRLSGWLMVLACCACGSHESKPPSKQTGGTISDGVMAAGHSASGEPSAGAPVAGGSAPAGPSIVCGSNSCPAPTGTLSSMLGGGLFPQPVACCFDEAEGTCGLAPNEGAECQTPATPDDRCPSIDVSALAGAIGVSAPGGKVLGCCVDDACGVDGALFGRGCVENSQAKVLLGNVPVIGPLVMVPAPRACVE